MPLRELTLKELDPYADGKARILLEGPAVSLTPRIALALGMVSDELATNASKYGALSVPQGQLPASAWSLEGATPQALRPRWSSSRRPRVEPPLHRGFGTELSSARAARPARHRRV